MNSTSNPSEAATPSTGDLTHDHEACGNAGAFDLQVLQEFVDLMGQEQALFWLEEFRKGLAQEFERPEGPGQDPGRARANIHHISARAGLIGFKALHEACLGFLETGAGPDETEAAYHRVCVEAERAFFELERQRAMLT